MARSPIRVRQNWVVPVGLLWEGAPRRDFRRTCQGNWSSGVCGNGTCKVAWMYDELRVLLGQIKKDGKINMGGNECYDVMI